MPERGSPPERRVPAHESHFAERCQRPGEVGGRATETAGYFADAMSATPDDVEQRTESSGWRGFLQEQAVRLQVQGSRRIQHQRVHRPLHVQAEGFGEFPIARHAAPHGVEREQRARPGAGERVGKVPGPQRAHGEGFPRPAIERRAGTENRTVHHPLTRTAHDHAGPSRSRVEPGLENARQRRVGCDQIRQLVEHERSAPAAATGLAGEPIEERTPVRVLDIGESGKPPIHAGGEIASLNGGSGRVGGRVQAVVALGPLDEQTRLAHTAPAPDDGQRAWMLQ